MREILFRGKNAKGEWEYGVPLITGLNSEIAYITQANSYDCRVDIDTVGQYTGLTDKNGKKIFEGDILKGSWNTVFVVYYDEDYLQFRAKKAGGYTREMDYYGESKECEIIGNIHDNPELMN